MVMSKNSQWKRYLFGTKTLPHRKWFEGGRVGGGRLNLEEKNLTRANLNGTYLQGARLFKCDLANSNTSHLNLRDAEVIECYWNNSLLHSIDFDRAVIKECNFADAYLGKGDFISAKVKGGDWSRCDLNKSTWTDAVVENACFERANFGEARFHGCRFVNCDLRDTNLESATLRGAVFENCDFRGAYLYDFVFEKVTFINCGFYGCTGIPAFEGEYTFISPDLSLDFDGTGIIELEELLEQWKSKAPLSLSKTVNHSQWLDYIFRENEDAQVDWVYEGMKDSPPMDVKEKNLSRAFAYQAYFRAARFTECDFTSSDLRRTMVQQAEFIGCKFNDALLMYLDGRKEMYLDVKTSKVLFQDCIAHGAYLNRSEFWIAEFIGGNWDGSFFNNCMWTCAEIKDVSFENTDWRGAVLNTVKFINCSFRNAQFHGAELRAIQFINCDFKDADFGHVKGSLVKMKQCGFSGTTGMLFDIEPLKDGEIRVVDADISANFDGSLVFESLETTQDLFDRIGELSSNEDSLPEKAPTIKAVEPEQPEITQEEKLSQLKQQLKADKKQLTFLRSQLNLTEERIKEARRTNIFGRKQSGNDERERDRLTQEIEDTKARIKQNESLLEAQEEQIESN